MAKVGNLSWHGPIPPITHLHQVVHLIHSTVRYQRHVLIYHFCAETLRLVKSVNIVLATLIRTWPGYHSFEFSLRSGRPFCRARTLDKFDEIRFCDKKFEKRRDRNKATGTMSKLLNNFTHFHASKNKPYFAKVEVALIIRRYVPIEQGFYRKLGYMTTSFDNSSQLSGNQAPNQRY